MKIALITDTHFGGRSDSLAFNEYFFKFWENVFFPYLEKHNIKTIIHLGDVVDRRKFINYVTLHSLRTRFADRLTKNGMTMWTLVGNHDIPYKNTNEVNAIKELFNNNPNINVIEHPITMEFDGLPIAMIPWINNENYSDTIKLIEESPASIAMGHLELAGFEMDRGNICIGGLNRETFKKFETVYTGHFHHRSTDGHIYYLGNTYEMTWSDYDDKRGFHIFDTETREAEFIENPYRMFHKVIYDDTDLPVDDENFNVADYNSVYVKVVVIKKSNPARFDKFMDALYKVQPLDISIVEDFTEYSDLSEDDIVNQADETHVILDKYVDGLEINLDKDKLKNVLRNIYTEAHDMESA
jgi:hypothetical protein